MPFGQKQALTERGRLTEMNHANETVLDWLNAVTALSRYGHL
jgi:hypothetical protein